MNELEEQVQKLREHRSPMDTQSGATPIIPEPVTGNLNTQGVYFRAADPDYGRQPTIRKCPLWALVHRLDGKPGSDRCTPGCQLYIQELGDCAISILARGTIKEDTPDAGTE